MRSTLFHGMQFLFFCLISWLFIAPARGQTTVPAASTQPAGSPAEAKQSPFAKVAKQLKKEKEPEKYIRLRFDEKQRPTALEVAIIRFQPAESAQEKGDKKPLAVDLVGAVHMAEPEFFDQLNKQFADYDAVLYELIAPEGTRPVGGKKPGGTNPLSAFQRGLTRMLDLEFQLEGVDYSRSNFVHADMSPDEFLKSMQDRGESVASIFARLLAHSMLQQAKNPSGSTDAELLMALLNKNRALALKRVMAKQFKDIGGTMTVLDGPGGSTLISQRNAKAFEVLRRELKSGKKKIAVFYGAGHMPDMAKRLDKDFNLVPTETRWLRAWNMEESKQAPSTKS